MAVENAGPPSAKPSSEKQGFTEAEWKRLCRGAKEDLRLNEEQRPPKEPRTPEEVLLSRLD
jgi:hypothetical protein